MSHPVGLCRQSGTVHPHEYQQHKLSTLTEFAEQEKREEVRSETSVQDWLCPKTFGGCMELELIKSSGKMRDHMRQAVEILRAPTSHQRERLGDF